MKAFLKVVAITLCVLVAAALLYIAYADNIDWLKWMFGGAMFLWLGTRAIEDWESRKQSERELKRREHLEILSRLDRIAAILDRAHPEPIPKFGPFFTMRESAADDTQRRADRQEK